MPGQLLVAHCGTGSSMSRHSGGTAIPYSTEYILPLRWTSDACLYELVTYLERLCSWIDVTVVDGSPIRCSRRTARSSRPRCGISAPAPAAQETARWLP